MICFALVRSHFMLYECSCVVFILILPSHMMFPSGTAVLPDTRVLISGGQNSARTTIYDPRDNSWSIAPQMRVPRGYHSTTTLPDGSVLAVGGSWSGQRGNKFSEVFDYATERWILKAGIVPRGSLLTDDIPFRSDNHMWLFTAPNGLVFQAGPSRRMHWMDVSGNGTVIDTSDRGYDSMNGNAVMYDIGKLLTLGGAQKYEVTLPEAENDPGAAAHNVAHIIDINGPTPSVKEVRMEHPRIFSNSVVLPNGQVVVMGGSTKAVIFNDDFAVLEAELFDPETEQFYPLASMKVPRTYHSAGILMKDGRVLLGGGGACGATCPVNHYDVEIFTPPYLLTGSGEPRPLRPVIQSLSTGDLVPGDSFSAFMSQNGAESIVSFALVRLGASTHATNCDLRRIPLQFTRPSSSEYRLSLPGSPNVVVPGTYWLFALDANGTPSEGEPITVRVM